MATAFTPRVFSGIQPSGGLTLGSYLGALKRFVEMQDAGTHECIYCMVDLHAITVWQDPEALRRQTREAAAAFMAAGIDPSRSVLFNQSQAPEHAQLAWVFNCVARMGWMSRMTQWKDKAGKNSENASLGLFAYPALMAADILAYHATHVPVGEDQKQHLELTRDIAAKFNHDFGEEFFPITEPVIEGPATRVMSLRDGTKKMSKSDPSEYSRITMLDDADAVAAKVRKATTDPHPLPDVDVLDENGTVKAEAEAERPAAYNLLGIYAALTEQSIAKAIEETAGSSFADFKTKLTDVAVAKLGPIGSEMQRLMADASYLDQVLLDGADKAAKIADKVVEDTYDIMGLLKGRR